MARTFCILRKNIRTRSFSGLPPSLTAPYHQKLLFFLDFFFWYSTFCFALPFLHFSFLLSLFLCFFFDFFLRALFFLWCHCASPTTLASVKVRSFSSCVWPRLWNLSTTFAKKPGPTLSLRVDSPKLAKHLILVRRPIIIFPFLVHRPWMG